jgi:hypothetical protein
MVLKGARSHKVTQQGTFCVLIYVCFGGMCDTMHACRGECVTCVDVGEKSAMCVICDQVCGI